MKLEGIHHVTAITADAPGNVDFYARVLGLRLVKKTVNQDDPTVYHLFYADEEGTRAPTSPSSSTRAPRGRAGAGMVHTVASRSPPRPRSTSGPSAWRRGRRRAGGGNAFASPTPEGWGTSSPGRDRRRAARRRAPRDPGRARAPGLRRRPRLRADPERAGLPRGGLEFEPRGEAPGRRGASDAAPSTPTTRRPPSAVSRRRHRSPRRLGLADGGARGLARARRPGGRAADARDRPLLLPLDLLPRAERRPLRDRHARPGLHRRRAARDARRPLSLPPAFEPLRDHLEQVLTPLPDPRARAHLEEPPTTG